MIKHCTVHNVGASQSNSNRKGEVHPNWLKELSSIRSEVHSIYNAARRFSSLVARARFDQAEKCQSANNESKWNNFRIVLRSTYELAHMSIAKQKQIYIRVQRHESTRHSL